MEDGHRWRGDAAALEEAKVNSGAEQWGKGGGGGGGGCVDSEQEPSLGILEVQLCRVSEQIVSGSPG